LVPNDPKSHSRANCPFLSTENHHKRAHPDANKVGPWKDSTAAANLLQVTHRKSNRPFHRLQYEKSARNLDGVWQLVTITAGPSLAPFIKAGPFSDHLETIQFFDYDLFSWQIETGPNSVWPLLGNGKVKT
jgi:hypothetical protein